MLFKGIKWWTNDMVISWGTFLIIIIFSQPGRCSTCKNPSKTNWTFIASKKKIIKPPKYFFRTLSASSSSSPHFPRFAFISALFTLLSCALHALCTFRQDASSRFLLKARHKLRLHWAFLRRGKNVTACVTSRSQDKFTVYYTMETWRTV